MSSTWNQGKPRQQGGNHGSRTHNDAFRGAGISTITAPYNFVPLSKKVFFPDWARHVSHDLPFEDGVSGELLCELVTHTPVYVRNGGKWEHDQVMGSDEAQSFFYVRQGGKPLFMIPGTTLKGMLRNVIEIASFGKMNKVDNHRYGVRDLTNPNKALYVNHMTETVGGNVYKARSKAAWLVLGEDHESWNLIPCSYARVEQNDLIAHHPQKPNDIKKRISSLKKYQLWGDNLALSFAHDGERDHPHSCGKLRYIRAKELGKGNTKGILVFTGQPAENKRHLDPKNRSKHMEFIFFNEQKDKKIPVPKTIRREFQFIHSDANDVPNEEWAYWKKKLSQGQPVPVFYLTNRDGSLHSMGLAMMFRLPYANSVRQAIEHTSTDHFHHEPDLAETIFGFVNGNTDSLKGRVAISPAVATHAEQGSRVQTVLGGPKPSFYPNYIEQPNPAGQYKTFMDSDCRVRGWKRYPARQPKDVAIPRGVTDKVDTKLIPLKENARFTFKVKFHNLKPAELGALAWALTWGNDNGLRHSVGMGKSMGYGLVSITVTVADVDWQSAMAEFENLMDREVGGAWRKTAQMEQLLAMANPSVTPQCGSLKHLFLAPGSGNEFVLAKKGKLALLPHVRPSAMPDAERFKNHQARTSAAKQPAFHQASSDKPVGKPAAVTLEQWPNALLTFNPGGGGIVTAHFQGKKADLVLNSTTEKNISPEILERLKGKKREAKGSVQVEPAGGGKFRIAAISN